MKTITIQYTHDMQEIPILLFKQLAKRGCILKYMKLLHYAMYYNATYEVFIQELILNIIRQFGIVSLHLFHLLLEIVILWSYGPVLCMKKMLEKHIMAYGDQIISFHFCHHLFLINLIVNQFPLSS